MRRKFVITILNNKVVMATLEDGDIVELQMSDREADEQCRLGNIYIGKVKKILSNIHAAFIEVENGVECYYDLKEQKDLLRVGDEIMVQISKEALKTKQPSVTRKISIPGYYCVLTADSCGNGVSSKIEKERREMLKRWVEPYATSEYSFIVRTNASDCSEEDLIQEVKRLRDTYEELVRIAPSRRRFSCLRRSEPLYLAALRNSYQEDLEEIVVEDVSLYDEMCQYLKEIQPELLSKICLYEDKLLPLHKLYSIEKVLEDAVKERVWMKSGAYLVIQPTEALTVIDVNTGKCIGKKRDDLVYRKINLEAAKEAAKQIRLRNLSGIILIDFINLDCQENVEELLSVLRKYLRQDPIQTTVVDITKLQLVEITRKKVRKPLLEELRPKKEERKNG